jgi:hypothetical protein
MMPAITSIAAQQATITRRPERLGGQLLAAFGAAALQDGTTSSSRHALQEAMFFAAAAFLGLIGSFRHTTIPYHSLHLLPIGFVSVGPNIGIFGEPVSAPTSTTADDRP